MTSKSRPFGSVRRLPSGRYQARFETPDGIERRAPDTFAKEADARRWLNAQRQTGTVAHG